MPNKYYLREDRTACSPTMKEPIQWDYETISMYNWSQHIASLPALTVDPDYLKRLSPGWFEGEEQKQYKHPMEKEWKIGEWNHGYDGDLDTRTVIVAPQEAELPIPFYCANEFKPNGSSCDEQCDECKKDENLQAEKGQEGEVMITLSKAKEMAVDFMWENKSLFRPQDGYRTLLKVFNEWFKDNKYFQKTIPATPQPVTGEEISFAELKWNIGSLFNQNIRISDNGKAIEGNPAVHAIAEYVHNLLAASRPSDAVEFAEWVKESNYIVVDSEELKKDAWVNCKDNEVLARGSDWYYTDLINEVGISTEQLYQLFLNSKSPNPNK